MEYANTKDTNNPENLHGLTIVISLFFCFFLWKVQSRIILHLPRNANFSMKYFVLYKVYTKVASLWKHGRFEKQRVYTYMFLLYT